MDSENSRFVGCFPPVFLIHLNLNCSCLNPAILLVATSPLVFWHGLQIGMVAQSHSLSFIIIISPLPPPSLLPHIQETIIQGARHLGACSSKTMSGTALGFFAPHMRWIWLASLPDHDAAERTERKKGEIEKMCGKGREWLWAATMTAFQPVRSPAMPEERRGNVAVTATHSMQ